MLMFKLIKMSQINGKGESLNAKEVLEELIGGYFTFVLLRWRHGMMDGRKTDAPAPRYLFGVHLPQL